MWVSGSVSGQTLECIMFVGEVHNFKYLIIYNRNNQLNQLQHVNIILLAHVLIAFLNPNFQQMIISNTQPETFFQIISEGT